MFATFVIGLREGLEAALIVGIIAAFLVRQGHPALVRALLAGVGAAVLLCVAVGIALRVVSRDLPQRQQEGLETVVGVVAVAMVTYMVIWMRRHSGELKGQLEGLAADAIAAGPRRVGRAMVLMAFLAVLREGFETVVFLLAAFAEPGSGAGAGIGAGLGIVAAVALGYAIYRGGARLNLSRFFRVTGLVLVLVAAGLVVNALHTAHEAGWLNVGQQATVDLSAVVRPGSVQSSLLTGMLGLQPHPVAIEVIGWLLYVVPVACYVAMRPNVPLRARRASILAALAGAAALSLFVAATSHDLRPAPALAAAASTPVNRAAVTVTAKQGCLIDHGTLAAGGITITVTNKDATGVTEVELLDGERIIAEKENLPPGFSAELSAHVGAGSYVILCPGATPERATVTVVGTAAPVSGDVAVLLQRAVAGYTSYVNTQIGYLLTAVRQLSATLRGGDLVAAQRAYIEARPFYEKIEPVAESFTAGTDSIDADLDARANDVPTAQWTGFHRIEKGLFAESSLAGLAPYGDRLVADTRRLQSLAATLRYQPTELANGAQELLDEVAASKITGEEERYSHIDMLDVANNVEGAEQAFAQLLPALRVMDSSLSGLIETRFADLDGVIDRYRSNGDLSGYLRYPALTAAGKRAVTAAVKAVAEPLSQVAGKIAAS